MISLSPCSGLWPWFVLSQNYRRHTPRLSAFLHPPRMKTSPSMGRALESGAGRQAPKKTTARSIAILQEFPELSLHHVNVSPGAHTGAIGSSVPARVFWMLLPMANLKTWRHLGHRTLNKRQKGLAFSLGKQQPVDLSHCCMGEDRDDGASPSVAARFPLFSQEETSITDLCWAEHWRAERRASIKKMRAEGLPSQPGGCTPVG